MSSAELESKGKETKFLTGRAWEVMIEYLKTAIVELREPVRTRDPLLRRALVDSLARSEEEQIGIDEVGDVILQRTIEKHLLSAKVFSENKVFGTNNPLLYAAIDPFDNSRQFQMGQDTTPYTVVAFYDLQGEPLVAGAANLLRHTIVAVACQEQRIFEIDLDKGTQKFILPPTNLVKSMTDPRFMLATYDASRVYYKPLKPYLDRIMDQMPEKARKYSRGGAFIYSEFPTGATSAYLMLGEPRSEIDPGFPLALAAGGCVVSVNLGEGTYEDYRFDPAVREPNYKNGDVPLLLATSTPELRNEMVDFLFRTYARISRKR